VNLSYWLRSVFLLVRWSALRQRSQLPLSLLVQTGLAVGIVVGYAFLVPHMDPVTALYLSTGAPVVGLITVGMVLVPQNVGAAKRNGVFDFNRSLPVPRSAMMAADTVVSVALCLPGICGALVIGNLRFDLHLRFGVMLVPAILLTAVTAAAIGYGFGYALKPGTSELVSQTVVFVALMFAPINYPASRLPDWFADVHRFLPFKYMAEAVRGTLAPPPGGIPLTPFLVLAAWCVAGLAVSLRIMSRRH
jgi:ABC-2 type transport system permease protein